MIDYSTENWQQGMQCPFNTCLFGTICCVAGSSNSSKYFASNDSSDTSRKARKSQEAQAAQQHSFDKQAENSLWSRIQHTSEHVMMTYQIHTRYNHITLLCPSQATVGEQKNASTPGRRDAQNVTVTGAAVLSWCPHLELNGSC